MRTTRARGTFSAGIHVLRAHKEVVASGAGMQQLSTFDCCRTPPPKAWKCELEERYCPLDGADVHRRVSKQGQWKWRTPGNGCIETHVSALLSKATATPGSPTELTWSQSGWRMEEGPFAWATCHPLATALTQPEAPQKTGHMGTDVVHQPSRKCKCAPSLWTGLSAEDYSSRP